MSTLNIEDRSALYDHLLMPETKAALAHDMKCTMASRYAADTGKVKLSASIFLARRYVHEADEMKAAEMIAADLNKLAAAGVMSGKLCGFSRIKLAEPNCDLTRHDGMDGGWALFFFPHVDTAEEDSVDAATGRVKYKTLCTTDPALLRAQYGIESAVHEGALPSKV